MTVNPVVMEGDSVGAVKTKQEKADDKPRKCYICGKEGHLAIVKNCPAKGKKCAKCRRYGNSALCCLGKGDNNAIGGTQEQGRRVSGRRQSYNANFVGDQRASFSGENCAFAFAVTDNSEDTCNSMRLKEPILEVNVNGIKRRVLIDSRSASNLIGMEEYEELKAQGLNAKMEDCHKRLYAYGGKKLEVIGQVQVEISVVDKKISSHGVLTKSRRCLLGHETLKALGLLRIGSGASRTFAECNDFGENLAAALQV